MSRTRNRSFDFQEVFEEHPIKSCIACFLLGASLSYGILSFLYQNKIDNLKDRYDDKIEQLKALHEQALEINTIKISKEEGTKYYLNIESNSKLAKDINKLIRRSNND